MNPTDLPTEPIATVVPSVVEPKQKSAIMGVVALITAILPFLVLVPYMIYPLVAAIDSSLAYTAYALVVLLIPAVILFIVLSTISIIFTIIGFVTSNSKGKLFSGIAAGLIFVINPIIAIILILSASFS